MTTPTTQANHYPKHPVLLGAIADALGAPHEQKPGAVPVCAPFDPTTDEATPFTVSAHHKAPAGAWTDDTGMTLALADVLWVHGTKPVANLPWQWVLSSYSKWLATGPAGVGGTIREAIVKYNATGVPSGLTGSHGSGTAMRAAPLGMVARDAEEVLALCNLDARLTHDNDECVAGSYLIAELVRRGLADTTVKGRLTAACVRDVLHLAPWSLRMTRTFALTLSAIDPEGEWALEPGGLVYQTVPGVVRAVLAGNGSVVRTLKLAVHPGGDADTRGALAGNLLGAWTTDPIPALWLAGIQDLPRLIEADDRLLSIRAAKVRG